MSYDKNPLEAKKENYGEEIYRRIANEQGFIQLKKLSDTTKKINDIDFQSINPFGVDILVKVKTDDSQSYNGDKFFCIPQNEFYKSVLCKENKFPYSPLAFIFIDGQTSKAYFQWADALVEKGENSQLPDGTSALKFYLQDFKYVDDLLPEETEKLNCVSRETIGVDTFDILQF